MTTPQPPEQPIRKPQPGAPAVPAQGRPQATADRGKGGGAPAPEGPGVVKRTTSTAKRVLLVVIGALVALFAVQNSQEVSVRWIFGSPIETPLIIALVITFAAGLAAGWLWAKLSNRGNGTAS